MKSKAINAKEENGVTKWQCSNCKAKFIIHNKGDPRIQCECSKWYAKNGSVEILTDDEFYNYKRS